MPKLGWTSAIKLRAGDILVLSNGEYVVVEAIQHEILESPVKVYNFEVEDFHTYFVGESAVLVHNQCTPNSTGDFDIEQLDWSNVSNKGETAIEHINRHGTPNYQRANHGVFYGDPQSMVKNAWANRQGVIPISDGMGGNIYNIPYKRAGYQSGYVNFGQQMDYITIITKENSSLVWSAFPSFGGYGNSFSFMP